MQRPAQRVIVAAGALSVLALLAAPGTVYAGQLTIASCQADRMNFSTTAFNDFRDQGDNDPARLQSRRPRTPRAHNRELASSRDRAAQCRVLAALRSTVLARSASRQVGR